MSYAIIPAVVGCVTLETCQQVAFSQSGRISEQKMRWLLVGIACYLGELIFWFWLLTLLPLGIATPLVAANYVTVSLLSHWLFKEKLDRWHWLGIACILWGIFIISRGM